uniref:Uncharacterized protein n=1 Tax=Aegilops tauschii TaxID=37682 RepID=M8CI69_AEGTA
MACDSAANNGACRRSRRVEDLQFVSPTKGYRKLILVCIKVYRIPSLDYAFYRQPLNKPQVSYLFLFFAGCSKKQDSQVHLLDAFQYIYFPLLLYVF